MLSILVFLVVKKDRSALVDRIKRLQAAKKEKQKLQEAENRELTGMVQSEKDTSKQQFTEG